MAICKFCNDRGCVACAGERQRYEARQTERAKNWQPPSHDDLETITAVLLSAVRMGGMKAEDAEKVLIDAAMPPPLFVAKMLPDDMELLKSFAHADQLEQMIKEAGGDMDKFMAEFMKRAEVARIKQAERGE